MNKAFVRFILAMSVGANAFAQDTTLRLVLNDQNVVITSDNGRTMMSVDLVKELKAQHPGAVPMSGLLDLKALRTEAKSQTGGGQVLLYVQANGKSRYVDVSKVETDPAIYESDDGFQSVELRNSEREVVNASLVVLNTVRLRNVDVVLGAPDLVQVLGTYGDFKPDVLVSPTPNVVASPTPKPTPVIVTNVPMPRPRPNHQGTITTLPAPTNTPLVLGTPTPAPQKPPAQLPPIQQPTPRPTPVPTPMPTPLPTPVPTPKPKPAPNLDSKCIGPICVGKHVYHRRSYWEGVVRSVDPKTQSAVVRFGDSIDGFEALVSIRDLALQ